MGYGTWVIVKEYIKLLRPHQIYKNVIVFVALIFSFNILNFSLYPVFIVTFIMLWLVSGANYILNDIIDKEKDMLHPEKCKRPIASRRVNVASALVFALIIGWLVFILSGVFISCHLTLILLALFLTNSLYTLWLKNVVILDVLTIALDYVWRALAGIVLIMNVPHPPISAWFIFGIFFVALLLACGKRRGELIFLKKTAGEHKITLKLYNLSILDHMMVVTTSLIILFYTLYCMNAPIGDLRLVMTIPIVVYATFRYSYLAFSDSSSIRKPEKLFFDVPLIVSLVIWLCTVLVLLYIPLPLVF